MNSKFDKESLIRILEDFGVPDPEYWAEKELKNNYPWLAAFRFLRPFQEHLDGYLDNPE